MKFLSVLTLSIVTIRVNYYLIFISITIVVINYNNIIFVCIIRSTVLMFLDIDIYNNSVSYCCDTYMYNL